LRAPSIRRLSRASRFNRCPALEAARTELGGGHAARATGVTRVVHVSSIAVHAMTRASICEDSSLEIVSERTLRPQRQAMNVAKAFANQRCDMSRVVSIAPAVGQLFQSSALDAAAIP